MRRVLLSILALVPLTLTAVSFSDTGHAHMNLPPPPPVQNGEGAVAPTQGQRLVTDLLVGASEQVKEGAHVYHVVCEACHGASGLGLAEGRLSFAPSDRYCERCHHPYNSTLWDATRINPGNSFYLGRPPAIRGPGTLDELHDGRELYAQVRRTMPHYRPGSLSDQQYLDVTAFVLALRNDMRPIDTITEAGAADIPLHPQTPATP